MNIKSLSVTVETKNYGEVDAIVEELKKNDLVSGYKDITFYTASCYNEAKDIRTTVTFRMTEPNTDLD